MINNLKLKKINIVLINKLNLCSMMLLHNTDYNSDEMVLKLCERIYITIRFLKYIFIN